MDSLVSVYAGENNIVARVKYNEKLDYWDGRNFTCGQTGRHLGYTRLENSGLFVLIHGSQWQGEKSYGVVCSPYELIQAALRTGHIDDVIAEYPELNHAKNEFIEEEESESIIIECEVTPFGNGAHVTVPKEYLGKKVRVVIS
jgi:putative transposon-encoded protein